MLSIFLVGAAASLFAQERFESGELKGFTISPNEHIIVEVDEPVTVRVVQGRIVLREGYHDPLKDVIFEIRGPGKVEKVRGAKTDRNGRFNMRNVPEGTYKFKATKESYQSVVGTIIVSRNADPRSAIKIDMPVGV